ncbi:HNH endonuclease [Burkholderia sp. SIMBA_048]|uniref:HNH endonuclease n=3 Tax=Bacteria TaxID=2 RepID=UPI003978EBF9
MTARAICTRKLSSQRSEMPTYLALTRTAQEDLAAVRTYITKRGDGWQDIHRVLPRVAKAFAQYPKRYIEPGRLLLKASDRKLAQAMYGLYDSKASYLRYKNAPRKPGYVGCCPYCGIKGSMTVDHYLPRSRKEFPHFSIFSANLVPACGDCQGHKLTYYAPTTGRVVRNRRQVGATELLERSYRFRTSERRILHPYFDRFLAERVLIAHIEMGARGAPSLVSIAPRLSLSRSTRRAIEFHLNRLHVLERAKGEVEHLHSAILKGLKGVRTLAELLENLEIQLAAAQSRGGSLNFFDALYLRALIVRKDLHPQLLSVATPNAELVRVSQARRVRIPAHRARRQIGR